MSTNVEIEAKIIVTKDEFQKVYEFLKLSQDAATVQINHYIDTPNNELRNYGFGLRIRQRQGVYTLTLKSPLAEGTLEKNQTLDASVFDKFANNERFPIGPVREFLMTLGFPIEKLHIITSLTTYRLETTYEGRNLALDKNEYNGLIDYEIESEQSAISLAQETLKKLCREVGIEYRPNKISKHARALKSLSK